MLYKENQNKIKWISVILCIIGMSYVWIGCVPFINHGLSYSPIIDRGAMIHIDGEASAIVSGVIVTGKWTGIRDFKLGDEIELIVVKPTSRMAQTFLYFWDFTEPPMQTMADNLIRDGHETSDLGSSANAVIPAKYGLHQIGIWVIAQDISVYVLIDAKVKKDKVEVRLNETKIMPVTWQKSE